MGPRDERPARESAAFGDWLAVERDLRAFLRVGLRFAGDAYERLWADAGAGANAGRDRLDVFEELTDGVWQHDYVWMHELAVLGEAVANYEAYVERAHAELVPERTPVPATWEQLTHFFAQLGVDVEPPPVRRVRRLRRLLANRRGELRTEHLRQRFQTHGESLSTEAAALDEHTTIEAMDALARAARTVDRVVVAHTAGGRPLPDF